MFTGIIETKAKVQANINQNGANRLLIESPFDATQEGESIAINGVCLTLLPSEPNVLSFNVSPETLNVTTLGDISSGDLVNLERSMSATMRFGGHYVSGHVDAKAVVQSIRAVNEFVELEIGAFKNEHMLYLVSKGSISVEGVSLTINAVMKNSIQLMLVPHTLSMTTLNSLNIGQQVNIEFDYLTRIVAHQLQILGKLNNEVEA